MVSDSTFEDWLSEIAGGRRLLLLKRLSANDTGQSGGHQAGFYIPNAAAFTIAPELTAPTPNPKHGCRLRLVSHNQAAAPVLTYYNNRYLGRTRDECRITGFGGRTSALQQPDSTGGLICLAFGPDGDVLGWLARNAAEEDRLEDLFGQVPPGTVVWITRGDDDSAEVRESAPGADVCRPTAETLPSAWLERFPTGAQLSEEAARMAGVDRLNPDRRLVRRFRCEYELFKVVEAIHLLPRIRAFDSVDGFLSVAQSALQRRKARAGRSLELQLARVFREEGVVCEWGAVTEPGHIPDALFPSADRYRVAAVGSEDLRMLAVKTTLKDRWRQVLEEADKIPRKHLFTLAEGVSMPQFVQIAAAGLTLVVPRENVIKFPSQIRSDLLDLDDFIRLVKNE